MKLAWKQVLLSIIIGFVFGAASYKWYDKGGCHGGCAKSCATNHCERFEHGDGKDSDCKDGDCKGKKLEYFSSELNFTEEQKTKVAAILDAKHKKMEELRAETFPKFEAMRNSTRDEISKILTPEQQTKFAELNSRFESFHKHSKGEKS